MLAPIHAARGEPAKQVAMLELVARRLDTHPHALRHSFAHGMRKAGAKDSEVQARLGSERVADLATATAPDLAAVGYSKGVPMGADIAGFGAARSVDPADLARVLRALPGAA